MDRTDGCAADDVAVVQGVWTGRTTIGDGTGCGLLAYVSRSAQAFHVDPTNLKRVAGVLGAVVEGDHLLIRKGRPLAAGGGFMLRCAIQPRDALPLARPVEIGDGSVLADRICSRVEPYRCAHVHTPPGAFMYSFKAPDYGMSVCRVSPGDTCVSWTAQETCETYAQPLCRPDPAVRREVTAWVCSML